MNDYAIISRVFISLEAYYVYDTQENAANEEHQTFPLGIMRRIEYEQKNRRILK